MANPIGSTPRSVITALELDDLKQVWQTLGQQLSRQHALTVGLHRERRLADLKRGLWPLWLGQIIQFVAGAALVCVFAPFWVEHRDSLHRLIAGLALHAYGLLFLVSAGRVLYLISQVDHSAPLLTVQRRLAQLRRTQHVAGWWFAYSGCFIWIALIQALSVWAGADLWERAPGVVGWLFLSGLIGALVPAGLWWWSRGRPGARLASSLERSAAGFSLNRAERIVAEIARFEQE